MPTVRTLDDVRALAASSNRPRVALPTVATGWPDPVAWSVFEGGAEKRSGEDELGWLSVDFLINAEERWIVYPSGLALPFARVNWFYQLPGRSRPFDYFLGNAEQAMRACLAWKIDPRTAWTVAASDVHGSCVFEAGPRFAENPRDWRLIQARSFPHWTGV